jgi:serine protease Do
VVDVVGWVVLLSFAFFGGHGNVSLEDLQMTAPDLTNVQPPIARAVRANVLIESSLGLTGRAIGAGVIMGRQHGQTLVLTNRHVVDPQFHDGNASTELPDSKLTVKPLGQLPVAGRVVWVAPDGIDAAVISAPLHSEEAESAQWGHDPLPAMGDDVFSIGNPQGLGWTHTKGSVSQIRNRHYGSRQVTMIQTDAAINPGNSGGGLYGQEGHLLGINTWTNDKRMSEGLSFALSLESILQLEPPFDQYP